MAKSYTGEETEELAVPAFQQVLRHPDMSFNKPFPNNESGDNAFIKCTDPKSAQAYCPERWKAMQLWIKNTVKVSMRYQYKGIDNRIQLKKASFLPSLPMKCSLPF